MGLGDAGYGEDGAGGDEYLEPGPDDVPVAVVVTWGIGFVAPHLVYSVGYCA